LCDGESWRQHDIPHERQHTGRGGGNVAEEIAGVRELQLRSNNVPEAADGDADVEVLVFAPGNFGTSGVPAEVVAEERAHEALRGCGAGEER
jgi:hypothetical protein